MKYTICLMGILLSSAIRLQGVEKTEEEVFQKWQEWQQCYEHPALTTMTQKTVAPYWDSFRSAYEKVAPQVKDSLGFLSWLTHGGIAQSGHVAATADQQAQKNIVRLFDLLENDMGGFLQLLQQHHFYNELQNKREAEVHFQEVIDKDVAFIKLLFAQPDMHRRNEYLFTYANHLFEYCFSPKTWPNFKRMLNNRSYDPLNRFIYATLWYYLVSDGWHNWSKECLAALRECAQRGQDIVYIAGGSDVYHLLKNGIYNVTVIDPQLPSQDTYYTNDWEWLVKGSGVQGGVGDRFTVQTAQGLLTVERVSYEEKGSFEAELSTGQVAQLPQSVTRWNVYDDQHVYRGRLLFERRYCQHDDLLPKIHRTLLFSYNELYYAALGKELEGWDVRPQKLPASFTTYVKQLRRPVGKQVLAYMRACESSQFTFIRLGSVPT